VSGLRQVKRFLSRQPLLRWWIEQRYERYFSTNGFAARRGVFQTFAEAYRSAPATKPKGFDSAEMVETFRDRVGLVCSHDYPVLFWLEKLLFDGCLLLDVERVSSFGQFIRGRELRHGSFLPRPGRRVELDAIYPVSVFGRRP